MEDHHETQWEDVVDQVFCYNQKMRSSFDQLEAERGRDLLEVLHWPESDGDCLVAICRCSHDCCVYKINHKGEVKKITAS